MSGAALRLKTMLLPLESNLAPIGVWASWKTKLALAIASIHPHLRWPRAWILWELCGDDDWSSWACPCWIWGHSDRNCLHLHGPKHLFDMTDWNDLFDSSGLIVHCCLLAASHVVEDPIGARRPESSASPEGGVHNPNDRRHRSGLPSC